jgi:hypothetical protein
MTVLPDPTVTAPRYVLEREEIDGSWRALTFAGRAVAYHTHALARAVAQGYGTDIRVRDTGGEP